MCLYIDEPSEVLHDHWRTAGRDHRCSECERVIETGERYRHLFVIDPDAEAHTERVCRHCDAVMTLITRLTGCEGWFFTMLYNPDPGMGMLANALEDDGHDLTCTERFKLLRCMAMGKRGWRLAEQLVEPPSVPEREASA